MAQPAGSEPASELYTAIAAIAATYGDSDGNYARWLLQNAGPGYVADASFLWNQPLSDSGLVHANATASATGAAATGKNQSANTASGLKDYSGLVYSLCVAVGVFVFRGFL